MSFGERCLLREVPLYVCMTFISLTVSMSCVAFKLSFSRRRTSQPGKNVARHHTDVHNHILSSDQHTTVMLCLMGEENFSRFVVLGKSYGSFIITVKPGLSDHPTVQAKAVVKARWSLEPGPTVGAWKNGR